MSVLASFKLESGTETVIAKVAENASQEGLQRIGAAAEVVESATFTFEQAIAKIKPIAEATSRVLRELKPDELEVSFGVTLNAELGIILASASAEANLTVTLTWKRGTV